MSRGRQEPATCLWDASRHLHTDSNGCVGNRLERAGPYGEGNPGCELAIILDTNSISSVRRGARKGHNSQSGMMRLGRRGGPPARKCGVFAVCRRACPTTYSFSDTGSDWFFGDTLSSNATNSRPEAGTLTLPWRTISLALRLRP